MKDSGIRAPLPAILRQVEIFRTLNDEERDALASRMERKRCRAGETIFREGDPSDGLYVVHSGEVAIVAEGARRRTLARIGPGECFGEMSLLTGEVRSTSVFATLDSELLFLRDSAFEALLRRYPAVALAIGRTLSLRLRRQNLAQGEANRERIVLCCSATTLSGGCAFASSLASALAACRGSEILLLCLGSAPEAPPPRRGLADLESALGAGEDPDLAPYTTSLGGAVKVLSLADASGAVDARLLGPLLSMAVSRFGGAVVSVEIDARPGRRDDGDRVTRLVEEALRQADAALLLLDQGEESVSMAQSLASRRGAGERTPSGTWRVTLLRPQACAPGMVDQLARASGLRVEFQVIAGNDGRAEAADVARIARRLSRGAVGLALGGGGARGLAHVGILEVFASEGIPLDVVGGTSIGSIISALHVAGHPTREIQEIVRREWVERNPLTDFTLPKTAFIRGRRGEKVLRRVFGESRIEDLPTPYFAVAADLVTGEQVVLSSGPIWLAVRASGSIPVLLTPVRMNGRFLVDGGIINNVPGDLLGKFGADVSVAVDVTPRREEYFERILARSEKRGVLGRLARRSSLVEEWLDYPGIIRTLRRIISISGLEIMETKRAAFDLCIQPEVDGFDLLDFSKVDRLVEAGREAALKAIPEIRMAMQTTLSRTWGPERPRP